MEARRIPLLRDTEVGAGLEEASAAGRKYRFRQYAREVVWPAVREAVYVRRHHLGREGARKRPAHVASGVAHVRADRGGAAGDIVVQGGDDARQGFREARGPQ